MDKRYKVIFRVPDSARPDTTKRYDFVGLTEAAAVAVLGSLARRTDVVFASMQDEGIPSD